MAGARIKLAPDEAMASLWRNRQLIRQLTTRDVLSRYRGSVLGLLWATVHPIMTLLVYTFVFRIVFQMRWGAGGDTPADFALTLFTGLILFNVFAECISRAPHLIISTPTYVKKVIFPLEVLPWVPLGGSLFHAALSILILLAGCVFTKHELPWTVPLGLLSFLPVALYSVGFGWLLSSLGVFFRDLQQFVSVMLTILMFLTPIFYPAAAVPEQFRFLAARVNPLAVAVEFARATFMMGVPPPWAALGVHTLIALAVASLGFAWFQGTRRGFADVI